MVYISDADLTISLFQKVFLPISSNSARLDALLEGRVSSFWGRCWVDDIALELYSLSKRIEYFRYISKQTDRLWYVPHFNLLNMCRYI